MHASECSRSFKERLHSLQKDFKSGLEVTQACLSCHSEAESQFHKTIHWTWLANLGGFYMPGRDRGQWLDILGWITMLGALAGVVLHATGRVFANGNNGKNGENSAK